MSNVQESGHSGGRHPKDETVPEILLTDSRATDALANEALPNGWVAHTYPKTNRKIDYYSRSKTGARAYIADLARTGVEIDGPLLARLESRLEMSIAKQLFGPDGKPVLRDGRIVHRLLRIGCRVYAKQHHLAASIGRDRKVVNARLMLMREHGIVWRVADGWLELNPHLVWCGPIAHRTGYLDWLAATGQQLPPMLTGQVGEGSDE